MNSILSRKALIIPVLFLFILPVASAHQPRLVMGLDIHSENTSLLVENPEISQAFYGELNGKPDYYKISLESTTPFYVGITAPDIPGSKTDFSVEVYDHKDKSVTQVILLNGAKITWKPFYEEFGGDWYLQGPEARENLTNVTYYIRVSSPSNQGKYALAIGEQESFPPQEILNAYILLPIIKQRFFGKPVLFSFFQYLGIILAMGGFFAASAIMLTTSRQRIKSAVNFYGKIRYLVWLGMLLTAATLVYSFMKNPFNILGTPQAAIFILLVLLFLYANNRIRKTEDRIFATLKISMVLSVLLWLAFLALSAAII